MRALKIVVGPPVTGSAKVAAVPRVDWQRIVLDHATRKYTDMELASKYGLCRESISRRRTADRKRDPAAWPVDTRKDVERATAALLAAEAVGRVLTKGHAAEAVLSLAHATKDVILGHRRDVSDARTLSQALMAELSDVGKSRATLAQILDGVAGALDEIELRALAAQVTELTKLHSRVSSLQRLSDSMTKLQTLERKAFGISDTDGGSDPLATMTDVELRNEIARLDGAIGALAAGPG